MDFEFSASELSGSPARHMFYRSGCGFLMFAACLSGAVLRVGPNQQYATPCRAIEVATASDTIEIDAAGTYNGDVCGWSTDSLTIKGVNGRPKINAAGRAYQGRSIWTISGNNTTVENIELTGARGPNNNAAGIFQLGANLIVRKCYIHNNENGILSGENASSHILIESTEFAENGHTDGFSHNIYIGRVALFTLRFSYSHDSVSGHLVKSRALQNHILYNRLTGEGGTSSMELDLPNGGPSYVIGNVIQQGPASENLTVVAYGEEGAANPNSTLYFVNNTVLNHRWNGLFIRVGSEASAALILNNIFSGPGDITDQPNARVKNNLVRSALFLNAAEYDFRITPDSPARNFGSRPGVVSGFPLTPVYHYVHPVCFETRKTTGASIDAGAYEFSGGGGADPSCSPNPKRTQRVDIPSPSRRRGNGKSGSPANTNPE
jgi:hypothetical protein